MVWEPIADTDRQTKFYSIRYELREFKEKRSVFLQKEAQCAYCDEKSCLDMQRHIYTKHPGKSFTHIIFDVGVFKTFLEH